MYTYQIHIHQVSPGFMNEFTRNMFEVASSIWLGRFGSVFQNQLSERDEPQRLKSSENSISNISEAA